MKIQQSDEEVNKIQDKEAQKKKPDESKEKTEKNGFPICKCLIIILLTAILAILIFFIHYMYVTGMFINTGVE